MGGIDTDGPWKGIISTRAPAMVVDGHQVFDWRLAGLGSSAHWAAFQVIFFFW